MQQPPAPPAPPAPPRPPQSADLRGATYTDAVLRSLLTQRSELKGQLESVVDRRNALSSQGPTGAASVPEYQSRLRALDQRSARLEQDIMRADDAIAAEIARGVAIQSAQESYAGVPAREALNVREIVTSPVFLMCVGFIVGGVLIWRSAWNRAEKKFSRAAPHDQSDRFQQLQQSVDVIALEVERIAEGQRYVTKVLNELKPALGAGNAQPIEVAHKSPDPVRARNGLV